MAGVHNVLCTRNLIKTISAQDLFKNSLNRMNSLVIRYFVTLIYTSLIVGLYYILYNKPLSGIDDANIYFIYVRNFFLGNGFVYHPTGEHVEGFTSMLWVLL